MKVREDSEAHSAQSEAEGAELLSPLVLGKSTRRVAQETLQGIVIGELVAMTDNARTPLVTFVGSRDSKAVAARSVVDLHGAHIGRPVVLVFEGADPEKPVVLGVLREGDGWPLDQQPGQVEVDADGQRLVVTAKEQLVLRCGKASITLTKAGKVLIEGAYVSSHSSGVNRVKGGSVQLD